MTRTCTRCGTVLPEGAHSLPQLRLGRPGIGASAHEVV